MRALIVLLILAVALSACGPQPPQPKHVQCYQEGEIVFDYVFDKVESGQGGALTVWIGPDSALLIGDCRLVP